MTTNSSRTTRRRLLQVTAGTAATGIAGCLGSNEEEPQAGETIVDERTATAGTGTARPQEGATTVADETETPTEETETVTEETESDSTETQTEDTETGTDEETETETDPSTSHQLRIIAAEGADVFEYSFTVDGDAEMVTTGEYNAVPKEETASGRGEEIVENEDGTVTINGVVADGGGDTFEYTGELVGSEIHGEAAVYVDGELVEETSSSGGVSSCVTIDEPGDYVLTDDISGSSDVCIDIRADDVTLDGDGHTVSGSNRQGTGISVFGSNVTVRNVTVRDFEVGVDPEGATVRNCVVTENTTGITWISPGSVGRIEACEIAANDQDGIAAEAVEGAYLQIRDSQLRSNGRHGVWGHVALLEVRDNDIRDNDGDGVVLDEGEAVFESNTVRSNGGGINLVGVGSFDGDTVADNAGVGISAGGDIELRGTTVRDNDGDGVSVGPAHHSDGSATITACAITGNGGDGIVGENEVTITDTTIADNDERGVRYSGWEVADARNNYWGASDGPSSPDDPDAPFKDPEAEAYADGGGDAVSESDTPGVSNVRFAPWREAPP